MVFSISRPGKPGKPGKNNGFQLLVHKIIVFTRFSWFVEALELVLGLGSLAISSQGFKRPWKPRKPRKNNGFEFLVHKVIVLLRPKHWLPEITISPGSQVDLSLGKRSGLWVNRPGRFVCPSLVTTITDLLRSALVCIILIKKKFLLSIEICC